MGASCVMACLRQEYGEAGRLSEYSPCRYSGRAICRFYVGVGLLLSTCLQGAKGWRGTPFLLAKSVTARSERKLVRLSGLARSSGWGFGNTGGLGAAVGSPRSLPERGCPTAMPRAGLDGGDAKGKVARHNLTLHNGELYNTVPRVGAGC